MLRFCVRECDKLEGIYQFLTTARCQRDPRSLRTIHRLSLILPDVKGRSDSSTQALPETEEEGTQAESLMTTVLPFSSERAKGSIKNGSYRAISCRNTGPEILRKAFANQVQVLTCRQTLVSIVSLVFLHSSLCLSLPLSLSLSLSLSPCSLSLYHLFSHLST